MNKELKAERPPKLNRLKGLVRSRVYDLKKHLEGKVLTIVDASFSDREQRKAVKDLVTQSIWHKEYHSDMDYPFRMYAEATKTEYNEPSRDEPIRELAIDEKNPFK